MPQHRSCLCCTIAASHQSNTRSITKSSSSSSIRVLGARRPSRNRETRHLGARRPTQVKSTLLTLALGGTSAIQAHRGSAAWEHVGNPSTEMMMKTEFASSDEPRCSQEQSSPTEGHLGASPHAVGKVSNLSTKTRVLKFLQPGVAHPTRDRPRWSALLDKVHLPANLL